MKNLLRPSYLTFPLILTSSLAAFSHCKSRSPQSTSKNITVESATGKSVMLVYLDPENNDRLGIRQCAEKTVLENLPKDTSKKEAISKQLTICGGSGKDAWSGSPKVFMSKMMDAIKTVDPDSNDKDLLDAINRVKTFDPNQHKTLSSEELKLKEARQKLEANLIKSRRFAKDLDVTQPEGKELDDEIKQMETEVKKFDADLKNLQEKIKSADPAQLTAAEETIETRLTNIMENVILATTTIRYNPIGKDKYGYRVLAKVLGELVPNGVASERKPSDSNNLRCREGYVRVPMNPEVFDLPELKGKEQLGDNEDFCVMKYEAKITLYDDGQTPNNKSHLHSAESRARGTPWVNVNRGQASLACAAAQAELITNPQWQVVARNIESVARNWSEGIVGGGSLNRGHSNGASALESDSKDESDWNINKRTHTLSNGEAIWDFAGNVMEWVQDDVKKEQGDDGYIYSEPWAEALGKLKWGPKGVYLEKMFGEYGGLGYGFLGDWSIGVLRGGAFETGQKAGVFYSDLGYSPTNTKKFIGFRCVQHLR